jgi:hypothetical protein
MIFEPPHLNLAGDATQIVGLCGWLEIASHCWGRWWSHVTLAIGILSSVLLARFMTGPRYYFWFWDSPSSLDHGDLMVGGVLMPFKIMGEFLSSKLAFKSLLWLWTV